MIFFEKSNQLFEIVPLRPALCAELGFHNGARLAEIHAARIFAFEQADDFAHVLDRCRAHLGDGFAIAASTSASLICCGRKLWMIAISSRSCVARSVRPALS